jgi:YtoQ family protein
MDLQVYLCGEVHSDWRRQVIQACTAEDLPLTFLSPVTDHPASDNVGPDLLGPEADGFWRDHKSAKINAIRTRTMIDRADVVVVRFGDKYRQWNAAFDAGYAAANAKPLIVIHPPELGHALKEVDAAALAVAQTPEQVAGILKYVVTEYL